MPEEQLEEIRVEILEALERFGGWTKDALAAFNKLDSILREEGRYNIGLGVYYMLYLLSCLQSSTDGRSVGIFRRTVKEGRLPGGQIVPPGYMCIADVESVHMNPNTYPNPEVFDPFRFSKLREQEATNNVKHLFTGTGKDVRFIPLKVTVLLDHRLDLFACLVPTVWWWKTCLVSHSIKVDRRSPVFICPFSPGRFFVAVSHRPALYL
jgi:hypothetical protein